MPVARAARPLPSTLTERAICVSVVLRSAVAARAGIAVSFSAIAYTTSALGERFRERGQTSPILLRRPDGESDAMIEQRHADMEVLNENATAPHALENPVTSGSLRSAPSRRSRSALILRACASSTS